MSHDLDKMAERIAVFIWNELAAHSEQGRAMDNNQLTTLLTSVSMFVISRLCETMESAPQTQGLKAEHLYTQTMMLMAAKCRQASQSAERAINIHRKGTRH